MASLRDLPDFAKLRVAVVGDLVADHYVHASPRRLSREAPVMVLRFERERVGCGGAANVARNVRALGAEVEMFGATGRDAYGRALAEQLEAEGIGLEGLVTSAGWTTPTKTRVLAAEPRRFPQQVLRIDREPDGPVAAPARRKVLAKLRERARDFDALVVSDYEYGLVDEELGRCASELAANGLVVVHDPRRPVPALRGLSAITPNVGELARFTGVDARELDRPDALRAAADALREEVRARFVLVTRGNLGMALFGAELAPEGVAVEASGSGEVTDVSGAGDTAAAVFALALAAGCDAPAAMALANAASGVVVMVNGTAVCTTPELRAARDGPDPGAPRGRAPIVSDALTSRAALAAEIRALRAAGRRVVLANGCFDLLHVGHVRYLADARSRGDLLVVAINSDASARRLKGPGRPLVPERERAELLLALRSVDRVCVFDEPDLELTLRTLRPDVHAKGTDYTADSVPEAAIDRELGIDIAICGDPKEHSTSAIFRSRSIADGGG